MYCKANTPLFVYSVIPGVDVHLSNPLVVTLCMCVCVGGGGGGGGLGGGTGGG